MHRRPRTSKLSRACTGSPLRQAVARLFRGSMGGMDSLNESLCWVELVRVLDPGRSAPRLCLRVSGVSQKLSGGCWFRTSFQRDGHRMPVMKDTSVDCRFFQRVPWLHALQNRQSHNSMIHIFIRSLRNPPKIPRVLILAHMLLHDRFRHYAEVRAAGFTCDPPI